MPYIEKGIEYLRQKLRRKESRVKLRYEFYDAKQYTWDFGISSPDQMRQWFSCLGWCAKAVDSLADRLVFREFRNDYFEMGDIFKLNNPDVFFRSAVLSALIGSCSFVYLSADEDGFPRLQVVDGANATGIIDPITGLLNEGYAVLERDDHDQVIKEAHFTSSATIIYDGGEVVQTIANLTGRPLLVPVIYRPDAKRPFGHSRISRACMSLTGSALRTIKRSEISAEFYSFPQKYVTGLSQDAEPMDKWRATISSMLAFTKDDEGDKPVVGQFTQQSMSPHIDQLRMFAALFAGETGLTMDDLGFASNSPTSTESLKTAHESLRLSARSAQRTFGSGLLNVGYLASCLRDNFAYDRYQFCDAVPVWEPIFEPDATMLSAIGDGAIKLNQAVPGYFGKGNLRDLTGIEGSNEPIPVVTAE